MFSNRNSIKKLDFYRVAKAMIGRYEGTFLWKLKAPLLWKTRMQKALIPSTVHARISRIVRFNFTYREKLQLNFLFFSYNWRQENDIWPVHGCYWQFCGRYRGNLIKIYSTVFKLLNLLFTLAQHNLKYLKVFKMLSCIYFILFFFNFDIKYCNF